MALRGRGNRSITGGGRPRRPMDWECGDEDGQVAVNTKSCRWLVAPSILRDGYTDPTLMSTMVWHFARILQASAAGSIVALGIIVWNGVTDVDPAGDECPGPITSCEADWVWLMLYPLVPGSATNTLLETGGQELDRRSQAKRKLGNDKGILLVVETVGVAADFHVHTRHLIKE